MNLTVDLIFYDTTTASFFTDLYGENDGDIRKYGRCKEGGWGPQVVVALAVTYDGLPVRCWVFPGNTSSKLCSALSMSGFTIEKSRRKMK